MPGLYSGFGNLLTTILIGTMELAYPRINNMSVILIPISYATIL